MESPHTILNSAIPVALRKAGYAITVENDTNDIVIYPHDNNGRRIYRERRVFSPGHRPMFYKWVTYTLANHVFDN